MQLIDISVKFYFKADIKNYKSKLMLINREYVKLDLYNLSPDNIYLFGLLFINQIKL